MMNRNESDSLFQSKVKNVKKTRFIENRKICDEVVVETQVLGVKPPQICRKIKEKCPKVWEMQKTKYKRKKSEQKNCINPGNNIHNKYNGNINGK